jgi:hypothetical protein
VLCIPGVGKAWQVKMSPDLRRGWVVDGPC